MTNSDLLERAMRVMPGGVSSPVRALKAVGNDPIFVKKAKGPHMWTTDDKQLIDMCMSFGPLIFGHAPDFLVEELTKTTSKGTSFGTSTVSEVELAEKMVKHHPTTDWVRFVNSGTEAVMSALRLARGITGRDIIIKFEGCYHGHVDSMLVKAGSGLATFGLSSSKGVPGDVSKNTIVLPLGDIEAVKLAFSRYGENIAALLIEGIPANNGLLIQSKEYMQELQKIVQSHGAMFILDEVITGFRLGPGGATEYYDLEPDLVTFGKVIGGGLPVGAYAGKKKYMEYVAPLGPVYQAGTLSGNPLAMAAGNIVLDRLFSDNIYDKLEQLGQFYQQKVTSTLSSLDIPVTVNRIGSIVWIVFQEDSHPVNPDEVGEDAVKLYKSFHSNAFREGVYLPPSAFEVSFLSTTHTESIIDEIASKLTNAGDNL